MEANEIMIGDLLRVTKDVCIKKGIIVRVRAIDADDSLPQKGLKCAVRCQPIDDIYGMNIGGVWLNFLEPIPLTAEILEKNGWNDWCEHSTIARSVSVLVEDNTNLCI